MTWVETLQYYILLSIFILHTVTYLVTDLIYV
jgi:hypothetical protein